LSSLDEIYSEASVYQQWLGNWKVSQRHFERSKSARALKISPRFERDGLQPVRNGRKKQWGFSP
jgi:uncharacterized protein YcsI (UPF0317 family)